MSAAALIEQLHAYGIRLVAANDGVNLRISGKPLTPDLRQQVLKHKTELLAYLAAKPAANDPTLQDWQAADQAYQLHACHCPQCRAAGRGHGQRCEEDTVIWRVYQNAPIPTCRSISHAKPAPVPPPDLALLLQAAMLPVTIGGTARMPERPCGKTASIPQQTSARNWQPIFSKCMGGNFNNW